MKNPMIARMISSAGSPVTVFVTASGMTVNIIPGKVLAGSGRSSRLAFECRFLAEARQGLAVPCPPSDNVSTFQRFAAIAFAGRIATLADVGSFRLRDERDCLLVA